MKDAHRHIIRRLAGDIVERRMRAEDERLPDPGPPEGLADRLSEVGFEAAPSVSDSFFDVASRLCISESAEEKFCDLVLACSDAPSPVSALTNLRRFLETSGSPPVFLDTIGEAPPLVDMLITTFGSSQYMADILIRNPGYAYWLMDARTWDEPDTAAFYTEVLRRESELFRSVDGKLGAIRRAHRRSLLKIGVRDLLGELAIEETTEKLSNLADAVAQVVLEIVVADIRGENRLGSVPAGDEAGEGEPAAFGRGPGDGDGFAVVALGKLGGRELNYSSDVDLVYVCRNAGEEAMAFYVKLARAFTAALTDVTPEGYLYRVDLRLRPDGQAGPLVNSDTSMRIYYENRGRPWEFQAMLKARVICGDTALGSRLLNAVSGLVFNPTLPYTPLEDIARMRAQITETIPLRDRSFNIKLMAGGIRDVEFIAQAFQLMHGQRHEELQTPNTLEVLERIRRLKLLKDWEADNLVAAYRFFRLVEHRLQMMHQIKTHTVPESQEEIEKLSRRVSRGPLGVYTPQEFLDTLTKHLSNVRTFSDSFFAGEDVHPHSVLLLLPEDDERAKAIITQYGIADVRRAMHVLHSMAYGSFPKLHDRVTRSAFEALLPYLLESAAETGDPDQTLVNIAQLSEASRSEASFFRLLKESPPARRRIVAVAGFSSYLSKRLCNQMEYFEPFIEHPEPELALFEQATRWGRDQETSDRGLSGLDDRKKAEYTERYKALLDRTRIGGFIRDHHEGCIATHLPEMLTKAVRELVTDAFTGTVGPDEPVALIVLGSFAVGEPRIFSDLDVIVVSDDADVPSITSRVQTINRWFDEGGIIKLDFRLRGEGASAPLVQDIGFYENYFEKRLSLWERVAFSKCRFWWGDEELAEKFLRLLRGAVALPFTPTDVASLVRSRKSIETLAPKTLPEWDTKRSAGGRYDLEYLTAVGLAEATPDEAYEFSQTTRERLRRLRQNGLLEADELSRLERALSLYTDVEYLMELQELSLPRSEDRARGLEGYLARSFEYWGSPKDSGVGQALRDAKKSVRECFDRFMGERAQP
jgi:glutamate-ammonia-ligase adenylyltransferase